MRRFNTLSVQRATIDRTRGTDMRAYLYRCRVCGAEIWTEFIELDKLTCENCHTAGKWLVLDVKNREKI